MKKTTFLFITMILTATLAIGNRYTGRIDISNVVDDKLLVEVELPKVDKDEVEYHIPKIVPGTYSISDFGRFASDFQAFDSDGNILEIEKVDINRWLIKNASKLHRVSYKMDDTFDSDLDNFIFEPGGTSIEEGKNFVINTFGFFGYLEGMKGLPYTLNITHPENFYGGTSMIDTNEDQGIDTFEASNYFELADSPIMYAEPDTTTLHVGGAEILVQVYSPNKVMDSRFVMDNVSEILAAQKDYLGGSLPIKKYAFLICLMDYPSLSGKMGALEHSTSSLYTLPEVNPALLVQSVRDIAAHEFFHIVTPLNIHSEEIGNFDFINPKMSQHLWMYEGVTEYSAGHVQIKHGLMGMTSYLNVLREKIVSSRSFNDTLPFTEMSKYCLDEYKDEYDNVYQKGALIGMALDIKLRKLSNGEYGVQELMRDLSKFYGKDTSFKDDDLFERIVSLTYPEIGDFFEAYVSGNMPLPYDELFSDVGLVFKEKGTIQQLTMGNISLGLDRETSQIIIRGLDQVNDFGIAMGYQVGDKFVSFNGEPVTMASFQSIVEDFRSSASVGDKIKVTVSRTVNGKEKTVKLKARAVTIPVEVQNSIQVDPNATVDQLALRKAWIGV